MSCNNHDAAAAAERLLVPFLSKTYDAVDDPFTDAVVSWSSARNSFVVWSVPEFSRDILPKYFKHSNFSSFVRQLNTYGFRKVDSDRWEFANESFLKGQKNLLATIGRKKKPVPVQNHQGFIPPVQCSSRGSFVEVGKFGMEKEVEILSRDKNVLMQEFIRLRQQQLATDHQLQTVGQRVQAMEKQQQQMMSFLSKAMQSPGFLAQLVQHQNEGNRRIARGNKKRRFPKQEEFVPVNKDVPVAPDGQVIKYRPLMNEAAKAMLKQILNINPSHILEPSIRKQSAFLIDDARSSSTALDCGSSSSKISEVALSNTLSLSGHACMAAESTFPVCSESTSVSEGQSVPNAAEVTQFPKSSVLNFEVDTVLPEFAEIQKIVAQCNIGAPNMDILRSIVNGDHMGSIPAVVDRTILTESEGISCDSELDIMVNEVQKLPSINDVFWEQFLTPNPMTGDTDEINSHVLKNEFVHENGLHRKYDSGWDRSQNMSYLTDQMRVLTSTARGV